MASESVEYNAIIKCIKELTIAFKSSPVSIANELLANGLISPEVHSNWLSTPGLGDDVKATELVTCVTNTVNICPGRYYDFMSLPMLKEQLMSHVHDLITTKYEILKKALAPSYQEDLSTDQPGAPIDGDTDELPPDKKSKKRPQPSIESESASKRTCLENDSTYESFEKLLKAKEHIDELVSEQNEKLKHFETLLKDQTAHIQSLTKNNKQLRKEINQLKQRCNDHDIQRQEISEVHTEQLKKLTEQIQKLQREMSMIETPQQTPNLPSARISEIDDHIQGMRRALHDVRDDWYEIGCEFEVGLHFLDNIKSSHGENSQQCLFLVLREWLTQLVKQGDEECKICKLTEVLRSPLLELKHEKIADTLDETWHLGCPSRSPPYDNEYYSRFYPF